MLPQAHINAYKLGVGWGGGPSDFGVTLFPIGLRFLFGTSLSSGLGSGLGGLDLALTIILYV